LYAREGRNLDRALELITPQRQQQPDDPELNDLLGFIYLKMNAFSRAITFLQQAVDARPVDPLLRYRLGTAYLKNGDTVRARRELRRALELGPSMPEAAAARSALGLPPG
jgi:Flp pilus assembly protein TadD